MSFGINQLVPFVGILVLEWKMNKRMIFDPDITFLLQEAYSWHSRKKVFEEGGNDMIFMESIQF